jgi:hypothetical protein
MKIKVKCNVDLFNFIKKGGVYDATVVEDGDAYLVTTHVGGAYTYGASFFDVVEDTPDIEDLEQELKDTLRKAEELKAKVEEIKAHSKSKFVLSKFSRSELNNYNHKIGYTVDSLLSGLNTFKIRTCGNFENLSFYLTGMYDWKIELDDNNSQVLVPYKKV